MRTITLAITNYNRFELLVKSFEQVLNDERIDEIIIVDDHSKKEILDKIVAEFNSHPKVYIYSNPRTLGVYKNKHESVELSSNEWVIVFDSDNIIDTNYIDALYKIKEWQPKTVYCPDFAKPKFDYRHFAGKLIYRSTAASFFKLPQFDCLINTMNCFVNRDEYLRHFDPETEPSAADSAYFNYRWLMAGNSMYVVPGLEYEHLVHSGSHYVQNIGTSNKFHTQMMNAFKTMK